MKVNPYLNFKGNTEEAFNFYKSVFGGEFIRVMRYKDLPQGETPMPKDEGEKIMHISLPIGDETILMGTDISKSMEKDFKIGDNMYICLTPDSIDEAKRIYKELSDGGEIEMPLEKTFWGDYFASFRDKYDIQWMIDIEDK